MCTTLTSGSRRGKVCYLPLCFLFYPSLVIRCLFFYLILIVSRLRAQTLTHCFHIILSSSLSTHTYTSNKSTLKGVHRAGHTHTWTRTAIFVRNRKEAKTIHSFVGQSSSPFLLLSSPRYPPFLFLHPISISTLHLTPLPTNSLPIAARPSRTPCFLRCPNP